ncbi:MAG: MdtA/MuxA family multidrug efflux RND transporter periplasmic adaptor subunit [Alphaproteobacteria bacterium]
MDDHASGPFAASALGREALEEFAPPAPRAAEPQTGPTLAPQSGSTRRRRVLWLLLLALLAAGVGLLVWRVDRTAPPQAGRSNPSGPMPVATAQVETADVPVVLNALGTVTPLATVTVKPQISGQLVEVAFKEGQVVKKGDFLAQIDPRPYQVALAQAEGQLAKDRATLRNSEVDLARYRTLLAQNSIARQTVDTQAALVQQNQGTIAADQAQVDAQKLNLTYARIVSPISGRVGLRRVDPGNYVQTSDTGGIVVITQTQPISVIFTLPADELPTVMRRMRSGAKLAVTAFDRTGATPLASGTLETVDNQIDTTTGMIKLRASFDNAEEALFANQFVTIQLVLDTMRGQPVIPAAAVQRGAPGTFVYLVKPDDTVAVQPVSLGPNSGERVAVNDGLHPGQTVVVDGADRLRDGAKIRTAKPGRGATGDATSPERPRGHRGRSSE